MKLAIMILLALLVPSPSPPKAPDHCAFNYHWVWCEDDQQPSPNILIDGDTIARGTGFRPMAICMVDPNHNVEIHRVVQSPSTLLYPNIAGYYTSNAVGATLHIQTLCTADPTHTSDLFLYVVP